MNRKAALVRASPLTTLLQFVKFGIGNPSPKVSPKKSEAFTGDSSHNSKIRVLVSHIRKVLERLPLKKDGKSQG